MLPHFFAGNIIDKHVDIVLNGRSFVGTEYGDLLRSMDARTYSILLRRSVLAG
jgi:hypothetical protein